MYIDLQLVLDESAIISSIDSELLKTDAPYRESELPSRPNDLHDALVPSVRKSKTLKLLPNCTKPHIDIDDPARARVLHETDDDSVMVENSDMYLLLTILLVTLKTSPNRE